MERYESLYPNKDKDANEGGEETKEEKSDEKPFKQPKALRALHAERPKMWALIEKTLPGGESALYRIRDRKSPTDTDAAPSRPKKKNNVPAANKAKERFPAEQHHHHHKDRAVNWKDGCKARKWQAPRQEEEDEDDGTGFFE